MAASVLSRAARRTSSTQVAGPSERVGPRVRIRLAPALSQVRTSSNRQRSTIRSAVVLDASAVATLLVELGHTPLGGDSDVPRQGLLACRGQAFGTGRAARSPKTS